MGDENKRRHIERAMRHLRKPRKDNKNKIKRIGKQMIQHYLPGHFTQKKDGEDSSSDKVESEETSLSEGEVEDLMNMLDLE